MRGTIHIFAVIILLTACDNSTASRYNNATESFTDEISTIGDMPNEEISPQENQGLQFMREEEKLARDVYIVLNTKWNKRVFNNISKSEQRHMDALKVIIDKYELNDPVINDEIGIFQNEKLNNLYNGLITKGDTSLVKALEVGAAIEEIDILDLQKELNVTDNEDITFVYENLMRGSRNHLRAFVKNLNRNGIDYSPKYLSKEAYLEIISGD